MPEIVATQEAEIRRIVGWSQPRQIVCETLSQKNPSQKRAGEVAQGLGPEFKPQYHKKKKKRNVKHYQLNLEFFLFFFLEIFTLYLLKELWLFDLIRWEGCFA
jgi:hypothetical protein